MVIPSYFNGSAVNYTCYKAFENSGMPLKSVIYPSTITETNQILNNSELEKIVYCPNYKTTSLKLNNLPKLKTLVIPGQRVSLSIDDETKNGLTIYAPSDSYAHEWAENNNIAFVAYESPAAPENYEFPIRITSADNVDGMLKVSFECYDDVDSFDIILAEYDDNGNVISTQTRTVPQMSNIEFEKHFTPVSGSYKIFVWNDKQVPYSDVWQG
jgi:hypothetical protein